MEFPAHRILSADDLADLIRESNQNGARFCFILGSGASAESGIRSGGELEMSWMNYLMGEGRTPEPGRAARTRRKAASMKEKRLLQHDFGALEHIWQAARREKRKTLPSEYYFDLYRLRFYPDRSNGYRYMEQIMERAQPSIGYHTLSLLLTENDLNNLLITTNFDSMVEDALAIYTDKKPLVVAHESLAGYIELDTRRPIIAKVHRGLFFEPFNSPDETNALCREWKEALSNVFQRYAPIVIGYGGGDGSLMSFLEEEDTRMKHGLYWCVREGREPTDRIKALVEAKDGCLVETKGFDGLMLALGRALYGDAVIPTGTDRLLKAQYEKRMDRYWEQFNRLNQKPELEKVVEPLRQEEKKEAVKREASGTMTYMDYYDRAEQKYARGEYEDAISDYDEAIRLRADFYPAYFSRGYCYRRLNRNGKAFESFTKTIERNPDYAPAYYGRGRCNTEFGRYEEAVADFTRALDLQPDFTEALLRRAALYRVLGQDDRAEADEAAIKQLKQSEKRGVS